MEAELQKLRFVLDQKYQGQIDRVERLLRDLNALEAPPSLETTQDRDVELELALDGL